MSTSKLQEKVAAVLFYELRIDGLRENYRPEWLVTGTGERVELDFYIEEIAVAIEVQGKQHYSFVPHFHQTREGFEAQLRRDRHKRDLCSALGILLLEISGSDQIPALIQLVRSRLNLNQRNFNPTHWIYLRDKFISLRTRDSKSLVKSAAKRLRNAEEKIGGFLEFKTGESTQGQIEAEQNLRRGVQRRQQALESLQRFLDRECATAVLEFARFYGIRA